MRKSHRDRMLGMVDRINDLEWRLDLLEDNLGALMKVLPEREGGDSGQTAAEGAAEDDQAEGEEAPGGGAGAVP